jgi:hypothetical protein
MSLAQTLYDRGNEIIYANDIQYKINLISAGFHFLELSNILFGLGDEEYLHKQNQSKDFYLDVLVDRIMFAAYKHRAESLKDLIDVVKPNIIFLDSFNSTDFIILYPLLKEKNIKFVFLQTMLSTLQSEGASPLNTDLLPNNQKIIKKAWKHLFWQRKVQRFKDKIKYLGKDDLSMVKQKYIENSIPLKYKIITNASFRISFANIPEWIPPVLRFCPKCSPTKPHKPSKPFRISQTPRYK